MAVNTNQKSVSVIGVTAYQNRGLGVICGEIEVWQTCKNKLLNVLQLLQFLLHAGYMIIFLLFS